MKFNKTGLALSVMGIFGAGEIGAHLSGVVDTPIYEVNNQISYIPAPGQAGSFLHWHDYRFNELSMGAGPFAPDPKRFNLLLVGDSVVTAGNPLSEEERLGPQL